ncbi:hypothetical protein ONS95_005143 [Cadophora gregata]|uniref:uncharacterized protein n=1 Tax=Cadophora gregata TaxID=51156 RepID=UPI0026DCDAB6|nr:uncharacterized protein ONS95_005143 [Cadophora gregata]KAK0104877.1 hypothetical protein ONS95_005143 [Cadophora gregata]KAK0115044.1 hypothetical protein ONS96_013514 [Cadophora gregata f. sp. sojae]
MRPTTILRAFWLFTSATLGQDISHIAGRGANAGLALPGLEAHYNDNVTETQLDRLYPGHKDIALTSFSFKNAGIYLVGFIYVQGASDVKAAIASCSNDGSKSGTAYCIIDTGVAFIGHALVTMAGGYAGTTITQSLSHVSNYAINLPIPPTSKRSLSRLTARAGDGTVCPSQTKVWNTPGNIDFNEGWAITGTTTLGCPGVEPPWDANSVGVEYAAELGGVLLDYMGQSGGSHVQFTIYDSSNDKVWIRTNLVVINGGNLCSAVVTGTGCNY